MPARQRIGILMSSGPWAVQEACADMDDIDLPGIMLPEDFGEHVADLDAVIISNDFYTPEVARLIFTAAPRLRWIQSSSTGYEHLDQLGAPRHLAVTEPGPIYSEIVAEHAVALLLALARGVLQMERYRLDRRWGLPAIIEHMVSIKDRNLLAIGFGQIGQETARRVRGFGMSVTALVRRQPPPEIAQLADRIVFREQLHEALGVADCVLLGIPLTNETHRFIDAAEFAAMKPGAILLNMARGPVLNEDAMIAALQSGHLGGAGLDVFEVEPLAKESPLWGLENVIISPHLSAAGDNHGGRRFGAVARENIRRFLAGERLINPVPGYPDIAPPPA